MILLVRNLRYGHGDLLDASEAELSKAQDVLDPTHYRLGDPFAASVQGASLWSVELVLHALARGTI